MVDKMKIPTIIVGLVVAIILVGSVLVPVLDDASWKETTATNSNEYYRMEWSKDFELTTGYVNETALSDITGLGSPAVVLTDKFIATAYTTNEAYGEWSLLSPELTDGQTTVVSLLTAVSVVDGAYTVTKNDETIETGTITWGLIPDSAGSMVYVGGASDTAKVTSTSTIVTASFTSSNYGVSYGTLTNTTQCFKCINKALDPTFAPAFSSTEISDTTAYSVAGKTTGTNSQYVYAPYSCTFEEKRTDAYIPILAAIPVMVLVAILVAATVLIRKP